MIDQIFDIGIFECSVQKCSVLCIASERLLELWDIGGINLATWLTMVDGKPRTTRRSSRNKIQQKQIEQ
ncbi:unnamed protein product [Caenorhabditis brenneri]